MDDTFHGLKYITSCISPPLTPPDPTRQEKCRHFTINSSKNLRCKSIIRHAAEGEEEAGRSRGQKNPIPVENHC